MVKNPSKLLLTSAAACHNPHLLHALGVGKRHKRYFQIFGSNILVLGWENRGWNFLFLLILFLLLVEFFFANFFFFLLFSPLNIEFHPPAKCGWW